jgi:alcohol dehydrogenase class IV
MSFEFATAGRIVFGTATLNQAPAAIRSFGQRPLVVIGRESTRAQRLFELLAKASVPVITTSISGEPTTDDITRATLHARESACDCVIGFGGGSVIDAAKAIAALLTNDSPLIDYLEVVGRAQPLAQPSAPCIAIPTTAGTGAEVTRNSVLASPQHRVKVSLRSPHMLPKVAIVDPELTYGLPPELTASTGLDALTQLIEPYVSPRANPMTDALCVEGIRRAARSLRRVAENGTDSSAREDMSLASLFGGLALTNAGLGAVHGFAGPIGGMFPAPHGAICAALLPHVIEANLAALRVRAPTSKALGRYDEIARLVTERPQATANDLVTWARELVSSLPIRSLSAYGITRDDFPAIVVAAERASSMKANPLTLTYEELTAVLDRAL